MKAKFLFSITLITFSVVACLANGFSQEATVPEGMVRLIYFLPKDSQAQPDINTKLDALIKDTQRIYADSLESYQFQRKTFDIETDANGKAVVHHVDGLFGEAHYHQRTFSKVIKEISERFDGSKHAYLIVVETSAFEGGSRIYGKARQVGRTGGYAMVRVGTALTRTAAHELGHVFGLKHDFRDNAYIMSYGGNSRRKFSRCAAEWLNAHPSFNWPQPGANQPTAIQMLSFKEKSTDKIRFRFLVSDGDGLVQAQLLTLTTTDPVAAGGAELIACQSLTGKYSFLTFVTNELVVRPVEVVSLRVLDKKGNDALQTFPIQRSAAPGPKIGGPWLWVIVPTGERGGAAAAKSGIDYLKQASKGKVTEKQIATKGAIAGETVGNKAWTHGWLAATGNNNIQKMLTKIGLGSGDIDDYVAYGSIIIPSPKKQQTMMFAGSDDAVKVWLNGRLVHKNPVNRSSINYQDYFPVTLKQGRNVLLVAVYDKGGEWSGFFGFRNDTE